MWRSMVAAGCLGITPALAQGPAPGQVRVCASDLTNFDDAPALAIPAGLVFAAWGRAGGDLRTMRLDPNYPPARITGQSALVTTADADLTAEHPCALVAARGLVSPGRAWRTPPPTSDGTVYEAVDTLGPGGLRSLGQEALATSQLLSMNILVAAPAGPIGDPRTIP